MTDNGTISPCTSSDFDDILAIINSAAIIYKNVIPVDRWKEPYMKERELREEIHEGVKFHGFIPDSTGCLAGVMGIQPVEDVSLIRHAYVLPDWQRRGIGSKLLNHLISLASPPILVGTWSVATWAISFYQKHGFGLVKDPKEKDAFLHRYWNIPHRQVETSVVLELGRKSMQENM
ncbi:GNAT family N-acetyltransferase [Candidatus Bathyarchaeota archaeon]|nr:GNAT family N-acetyltransferase [Candidatus Bathyarchaeota archaeon]